MKQKPEKSKSKRKRKSNVILVWRRRKGGWVISNFLSYHFSSYFSLQFGRLKNGGAREENNRALPFSLPQNHSNQTLLLLKISHIFYFPFIILFIFTPTKRSVNVQNTRRWINFFVECKSIYDIICCESIWMARNKIIWGYDLVYPRILAKKKINKVHNKNKLAWESAQVRKPRHLF